MPYSTLLAVLLVFPAVSRAQPNEEAVEEPGDCPPNTVAVRDARSGLYACKPRLQRRRDVFGANKHPQDPCPDGYWWHRTRDSCKPVVCTEESNPGQLKGLCLAGQHEHLSSSEDWTHPITCVVDYRKSNEAKGGRNPVHGACDLCVIDEPGHTGGGDRPWAFQKPDAKRKAGASAPSSGGGGFNGWKSAQFKRLGRESRKEREPEPKKAKGCSEGTYTAQGKCVPCADGAATVRRDDGRTTCVGGEAATACPVGAGVMVVGDPSQPMSCVPCIQGEESLTLNGVSQCLRNPCPEGELPVPEEGIVDRYACAPPLEGSDGVDWTRILAVGNKTPAHAPVCARGEGIAADGRSFRCRACSAGLDVVQRNGYPVCGRKVRSCQDGAVLGEDGGCVKCPEGSKVAAEGGRRSPRCVPQSAPAAIVVSEDSSLSESEGSASLPPVEPDRGPRAQPPAQAAPVYRPKDELPPMEPAPQTPSRIFPTKTRVKKELSPTIPLEQPITMPKAKPEAWEDSGQASPQPKREPQADENGKLSVPMLR